MRCTIIDDEPLARRGIVKYIQQIPLLKLEGEYDNPIQAAERLSSEHTDLLFLDVLMNEMTGIELLNSRQDLPVVVLITASPDYAIPAFQFGVADYLVKPVLFERFLKASLKAKEVFEYREFQKTGNIANSNSLFIKSNGLLEKVMYDDIIFIEALHNYITIHTTSKKLITYSTLKNMEAILPAFQFLKIHKSYIISLQKIEQIKEASVYCAGHKIPIGRAFMERLRNVIK